MLFRSRQTELLRQAQELQARKVLGGETEGAAQVEKPKEETPDEYRKRIELGLKEGTIK